MAVGIVTLTAPDGSSVRFDRFPVVLGRAGGGGPEGYCDLGGIDVESKVSRRHVLVAWEGDLVTLTDQGSTNGTTLNGVRLAPHQPVPVPGARSALALGPLALTLQIEVPSVAAPPPAPTPVAGGTATIFDTPDAAPPPTVQAPTMAAAAAPLPPVGAPPPADAPPPPAVEPLLPPLPPLPQLPPLPPPPPADQPELSPAASAGPGATLGDRPSGVTREAVEQRALAEEATVAGIAAHADVTPDPGPDADLDPFVRETLRGMLAPGFEQLVVEEGARPRILGDGAWRDVGLRAVDHDQIKQLVDALTERGALQKDGSSHHRGIYAGSVAIEVLAPPRTPGACVLAERLSAPAADPALLAADLAALGPALAAGRGVLLVGADSRALTAALDAAVRQVPAAARVAAVEPRPILGDVGRPLVRVTAVGEAAASVGADVAVLAEASPAALAAVARGFVRGGALTLASTRAADVAAVRDAAGVDLTGAFPVSVSVTRDQSGAVRAGVVSE